MNEEPDIVKMLREVEKLGGLWAKTTNNVVELEVMKEPVEEASEETTRFVKDDGVEKRETVCDATGYEKVEEKLRLFLHSTESSTDSIAMGNLEGKITYVNEAFVRMFGYSRKELMGKEIPFIYPEDQLPKLEEAFKATMEKGGWTGELLGKRKNGEIFQVAVSSSRVVDDEGKVIAHMASHRDITERKKTEEEIKYLKEYNENILESNPNPIMVIKGNQIEYVNNSFVSTFGKTKNDYISKELKEVLPAFEKLLQDQNKMKELEIKDKSFSVSSFVVKKAEEEEEEEEEERRGIILQDITERKRAEEKLNAKIAELEQYKKVTVGRELKMAELKNRIKELEDKLRGYEYVDIPKKTV